MGRESRKSEILKAVAKDMKRIQSEVPQDTPALAAGKINEADIPGELIGVSKTSWYFEWYEEPGERGWKLWMKPNSQILSVHRPKPRLLMTVAAVIMRRNPLLMDYFLDSCLTALNTSRTVIKLEAEEKCTHVVSAGVVCGQNTPCKDHPEEPEPVVHDEPKGEM
jgi:hypothetical protein